MSVAAAAAAPAAAPAPAKRVPAMSMAADTTAAAGAMTTQLTARVACPTLPPAPAAAKKFSLTAGTLAGSTTQTLAYNGATVGPLIRVRRGDLVEVDVANKDIADGTSVHWHGQVRGYGNVLLFGNLFFVRVLAHHLVS
jgi:FtsP/CotA-like multicopper oxidase with cupredoxin domain